MNLTDIINLITNTGVALFVVAYFIYKDNKFNNEFIERLTEISCTMKDIQEEVSNARQNTEVLKHESNK